MTVGGLTAFYQVCQVEVGGCALAARPLDRVECACGARGLAFLVCACAARSGAFCLACRAVCAVGARLGLTSASGCGWGCRGGVRWVLAGCGCCAVSARDFSP